VAVRRCATTQLPQVLLVHRQDQIEGVEVARAHHACAQRRQVDAATTRRGDRTIVRRLALVVVVRACRIDLH
jgi:hypothetical protein